LTLRRAPDNPQAMPLLDPELLLRAYSIGVFPMADSRDARDVFWVEPRRRAIIPLDGFKVSRSLRKAIRSGTFTVTRDRAFAAVLRHCAEREETWINNQIERSFNQLHRLGRAHSIECWQDEELVGGLYGVRIGGAFFGESMFSLRTDASKVALAWLVARLRTGGFTLLDCQFLTPHLASLGAIEVGRADYIALLEAALSSASGTLGGGVVVADGGAPAPFGALDRLRPDAGAPSPSTMVSGPLSGKVIVQLLGQTS
jgi:leucyl/phenylalanyl-tRNA--protein transferase